MRNDDRLRSDVATKNDHLLPSLDTRAPASSSLEEIVKLGTENIRLQRLVAELLAENQQLRQRYCVSRRDAGSSSTPAVPSGDRHDNHGGVRGLS
jgi:hypothetical protein